MTELASTSKSAVLNSLTSPSSQRTYIHARTDHTVWLTVAFLRSQLANARSEKQSLTHEIHSPLTPPTRKSQAMRRYATVNADLRNIAAELEMFIAATKNVIDAKKSS